MENFGCLKYISYWVGVPLCVVICAKLFGDRGLTIGFFAGFIVVYLIWKFKENFDEESFRRLEKERKQRYEHERKKQKISEAIELSRKYPEATKYYFKLFWEIDKHTLSEYDITYERAIKLLSKRYEYEYEERQRNATYRAKVEQEQLKADIERQRRLEIEKRIAEQKRRDELYAKQKKEEERKNLSNTLPLLVSSWNTKGSLKHKHYYDYFSYAENKHYPTIAMRNTWLLVWNFKNDPTRNISTIEHEQALNTVVKLVEDTLSSTFGTKTEYLTLVCLTASTQYKTDRRLKDFSEKVCSDLHMINAYPYIKVTRDGMAKHEGGVGFSEKSYDKYFFNGKYVVLFDDVRTSGRSLEKEKLALESLGAQVVCAITIAQTV